MENQKISVVLMDTTTVTHLSDFECTNLAEALQAAKEIEHYLYVSKGEDQIHFLDEKEVHSYALYFDPIVYLETNSGGTDVYVAFQNKVYYTSNQFDKGKYQQKLFHMMMEKKKA